ncbi:MAG: hypothetical protein LBI09_02715 [Nitrososphaerota archaeon]|jgi:hypothetical protein|nr:hypothetical protein [Nitrososphaerota archaeon]
MIRKIKLVGIAVISLLICSSFVSVCSVKTAGVSGFTAKEKLPALLTDVFGLDLSKYTITNEGYGIRYEGGDFIEVEQYVFTLVDADGGNTRVGSEFYNGFPEWVNVYAETGSMYYTIEPPNGSIDGIKNVFERYTIFAQKYDIATIDRTLALNLLSKAPADSLPMSALSPAKVSSDDMSLYISQRSLGFCSIIDGVDIPNKTWGINFMSDRITFHDVFEFYGVFGLGVFSEAEFTSFAFDLVKKFCDASVFYDVDRDGVVVEVKPDWSRKRSDIGFLMIPGQFYNSSRNNNLLEQGVGVSMGNTVRDALMLYPLWSAVFYFSQPIGNIEGVQVGVWGDTREVAYCDVNGYLGSSQYSYGGSLSDQTKYGDLLGVAVVALIVIVTIAAIAVFVKKKHKIDPVKLSFVQKINCCRSS